MNFDLHIHSIESAYKEAKGIVDNFAINNGGNKMDKKKPLVNRDGNLLLFFVLMVHGGLALMYYLVVADLPLGL